MLAEVVADEMPDTLARVVMLPVAAPEHHIPFLDEGAVADFVTLLSFRRAAAYRDPMLLLVVLPRRFSFGGFLQPSTLIETQTLRTHLSL